MLIGSGLGILDIIFVLALIGFALWKKGWIRTILSVCITIWGIFAIDYDIKVAVPLLGIGMILFIMGIMRMIQQSRTASEDV